MRVDAIRIGAFVTGAPSRDSAALVLVASIGGFDSTSSGTYLLPAFAAVFLGTAVVRPGRFSPIGTLVAIYFQATGILGLQLLGYSGWIEDVFYGAALVVAVSLATVVRRRTASIDPKTRQGAAEHVHRPRRSIRHTRADGQAAGH